MCTSLNEASAATQKIHRCRNAMIRDYMTFGMQISITVRSSPFLLERSAGIICVRRVRAMFVAENSRCNNGVLQEVITDFVIAINTAQRINVIIIFICEPITHRKISFYLPRKAIIHFTFLLLSNHYLRRKIFS